MKISMYQNTKECYFWTKDELSFIEENYPMYFKIDWGNVNTFNLKGHEVSIETREKIRASLLAKNAKNKG